MKKSTRDTAIFFSILYWLLVYILIIRKKLLLPELHLKNIALLFAAWAMLLAAAPLLQPLFRLILKASALLGSLIFAMLSIVVYYLILTPVALLKRLKKDHLLHIGYDREKSSYYEDYHSEENYEKQY